MFDEEDSLILGVCYHISRNTGKPVNIIRWLFIICLFMGAPVIIYFVLWLLIELEVLK